MSMGEACRVVKLPAMVPAMAGGGVIIKSIITKRGSRKTLVINRMIFLDFNIFISLWLIISGFPLTKASVPKSFQ
jgi:hypothetical protein